MKVVTIVFCLSLGAVEEEYGKKVFDEEIASLQDAEVLLVDNNILAEVWKLYFVFYVLH